MFEQNGTVTILGLSAEEWEAVSHGIDGALSGDPDWQSSLAKLGNNCKELKDETAYKNCIAEVHYFRFAFTGTRYIQDHWAAISGAGVAGFAAAFTAIAGAVKL